MQKHCNCQSFHLNCSLKLLFIIVFNEVGFVTINREEASLNLALHFIKGSVSLNVVLF